MAGNDWLRSGEFTVPPPPGGGLPLGKRVPRSTIRTGPRVDLRYHDRHNSGRLEVLNLGSEAIRNVDIELPSDVKNFRILSDDLPIEEIPPGKSVKLISIRTSGRGKSHFYVRVTYENVDSEPFEDQVFLDLVD